MSVLDITSVDGGAQLDELDFAGVGPLDEGPTYNELLEREAKLSVAAPDSDLADRSAFEDGVDIGRQSIACELLDKAPGGFRNQAEAARWARWAADRLTRLTAAPTV